MPELTYGTKKNRGKTCDWVLAAGGASTIFEVKAARIALPGRLSYPAYLDDMQADVGKALESRSRTAELIRTGDQVSAGYNLPTDVYGVVVTAEPHLMIDGDHYRNVMPDPGCPYVVLPLRGDVTTGVGVVRGHRSGRCRCARTPTRADVDPPPAGVGNDGSGSNSWRRARAAKPIPFTSP